MPHPPAAHAYKSEDKLEFRGLIASLDGKEILETSGSGDWSFESGQKVGTDAGAELKAKAPEVLRHAHRERRELVIFSR